MFAGFYSGGFAGELSASEVAEFRVVAVGVAPVDVAGDQPGLGVVVGVEVARIRRGFARGAHALPPGRGRRLSGPNSSRQMTVSGSSGAGSASPSAIAYSSRIRFFCCSKAGSLERFQLLTA